MKKNSFLQLLKIRNKQKKTSLKKTPPKWLYPKNAEKSYDKLLYSLVKELKNLIKINLLPAIPTLIDEVESKMPNDRLDDFLSTLNTIIIFISESLKDKVDRTILGSELIFQQVNKFNYEQFQKLNNSIFGIDVFSNEPWLKDQSKIFSAQNAQLIKSLPIEELARVSQDVERGLQQGERFTDIAETIQKSFGITHRRAKLIARDQTQKLNNSLTKLRQQEVGVEEYIWQTSDDERVRQTHKDNDGKKFRWDTPPPITGHPGNDVNCRCIARPVLDKLL